MAGGRPRGQGPSGDGERANALVRRIGAGVLFGLAVVLMLLDVFSESYHLDPISLGLVLGAALLLLGVEAGKSLFGR